MQIQKTAQASTNPERFTLSTSQPRMLAVVTTGIGGYERLEYREVPLPVLGPGEMLLQVLAAGVNNTEINTRVGWYDSAVAADTESQAHQADGRRADAKLSGWSGATAFPLIQGTDCCGRVVAVAADVEKYALGRRALV